MFVAFFIWVYGSEKIQLPLMQFGVTALIFAKAPAVLPNMAFVLLVHISTQWEKNNLLALLGRECGPRRALKGSTNKWGFHITDHTEGLAALCGPIASGARTRLETMRLTWPPLQLNPTDTTGKLTGSFWTRQTWKWPRRAGSIVAPVYCLLLLSFLTLSCSVYLYEFCCWGLRIHSEFLLIPAFIRSKKRDFFFKEML